MLEENSMSAARAPMRMHRRAAILNAVLLTGAGPTKGHQAGATYPGQQSKITTNNNDITVYPAEKGLQVLSPWLKDHIFVYEDYALDDLKEIGARWARIAQGWDEVQSNGPTSWNWSFFDRVVQKITRRGIKPMIEITFNTPSWARPVDSHVETLPTDLNSFSNYCSEMVKRYAPQGVHAWEIFNEPIYHNTSAAYGPVLKAAYEAIKVVDLSAEVIVGGNPLDKGRGVKWMQDLYNLGYGQYFTAVGVHPYDYQTLPSQGGNWLYMEGNRFSLRNVMTAAGDSAKKIWITEMGYASCHPTNASWTEKRQAQWLKDSFDTFKTKSWAGPLFWYSYRDNGITNSTTENCYGIVRKDFTRKLAYDAFKQIQSSS